MPREALLHLESWSGHRTYVVTVLAETPKRFRIRLEEEVNLPSRAGAPRGFVTLVPRHAITFPPSPR